MNIILALVARFGRHIARQDDSLRANQGGSRANFSFWRALVS